MTGLRDLVGLLARIGVGVVFVSHGWQKLQHFPGTKAAFAQMGIPLPDIAAAYTTFVELAAGTAMILGLALPLAGLALFSIMAGAFWFVHFDHGLFIRNGGFEYVLVLGLMTLLLGFGGGGRLALDQVVFTKRSKEEQPA